MLIFAWPDPPGHYGRRINVWDWSSHTYLQAIDLGKDSIPLEIRFLHNPDAAEGFVGCALSGTVHRFYKTEVVTATVTLVVLEIHWSPQKQYSSDLKKCISLFLSNSSQAITLCQRANLPTSPCNGFPKPPRGPLSLSHPIMSIPATQTSWLTSGQ